MMRPGRHYINAELRLTANFYDDDGDDTDPTTITCTVMSPSGAATTYTYATDTNIGRTDAGDYYCDVTPDESGRWFVRWAATGSATTVASESNFIIDYSPHFEQSEPRYVV